MNMRRTSAEVRDVDERPPETAETVVGLITHQVAGSNPAPATNQGQGPIPNKESAFCLSSVHGIYARGRPAAWRICGKISRIGASVLVLPVEYQRFSCGLWVVGPEMPRSRVARAVRTGHLRAGSCVCQADWGSERLCG